VHWTWEFLLFSLLDGILYSLKKKIKNKKALSSSFSSRLSPSHVLSPLPFSVKNRGLNHKKENEGKKKNSKHKNHKIFNPETLIDQIHTALHHNSKTSQKKST
jgi:hypothetical protein